MTEREMWDAYILKCPCDKDKKYQAWCYGSDVPDLLAELTVTGTKTATASAFLLYEFEKSELPKVGELNIILNTKNQAVCVTKTTKVSVVPFSKVSADHAYKEGEGDRSLRYWRTVHTTFFTKELAEFNAKFDSDMLVVCEEFQVVFKD